ncbi:MAG TPA: trehalose-phosphatase [Pseudonocardiaceae bacterium]
MSATSIADLPHALREGRQFALRLAGRRPAVFLDYDGTLTPIVDRPEDAVISDSMRQAVRELALRCPVCVVSGRDRLVVQELLGIDDLVIAGSHGFDISEPGTGTAGHQAAGDVEDLVAEVTDRLRGKVDAVPGVLVEPKRASVAVHYRLAAPVDRPLVDAAVDALLAAYPGQLKVTPGKMVYEIQPAVDWHKGKAVLYLLRVLGLDCAEVVPLYLGDDITDEDAFHALAGRGIGVLVTGPVTGTGTRQDADRPTEADFVLESTGEVERFLNTLGH